MTTMVDWMDEAYDVYKWALAERFDPKDANLNPENTGNADEAPVGSHQFKSVLHHIGPLLDEQKERMSKMCF
jgi:hypothetical protein